MRNPFLLFCLFVFFCGYGCASNRTRGSEGAVIGGLLGAAAGGIIGQQGHHGTEGALIGAAAGAAAGGIAGSQIEKQQQPKVQQPEIQEPPSVVNASVAVKQQYTGPNQLTVEQVMAMLRQGIDEKVIVDKILLSGSRYNLTDAQIVSLKSLGASQFVIGAMTRKS